VNIVTGWSKPEFQSLGLWPGDAHFQRRYDHAAEYVRIMRDLWDTGESTLDGEFCKTDGAKLLPKPGRIEIVAAGQSSEGMRFVARHGDYNFIMGAGINAPLDFTPVVERLMAARDETGRNVGAYVLFFIIAEATDEAALTKWEHYQAGVDDSAIANLAALAGHNKQMSEHSSSKTLQRASAATGMGVLVGSYARVAAMLDQVAEVVGVAGIMLVFDDFLAGLDTFGQEIQPRLHCRG